MSVEIEKKYRLTKKQREEVLRRLPKIGAKRKGKNFEVNTLYAGSAINSRRSVLRLRRVGKRAIFTYKEGLPSRSGIKHRREDETQIDNPDAMEAILEALGLTPSLVYEKRRERWRLGKTEIVVDELPFGLFMEIEGADDDIRHVESRLAIRGLRTEPATYPQLARRKGTNVGGVVESRFVSRNKKRPRSY